MGRDLEDEERFSWKKWLMSLVLQDECSRLGEESWEDRMGLGNGNNRPLMTERQGRRR